MQKLVQASTLQQVNGLNMIEAGYYRFLLRLAVHALQNAASVASLILTTEAVVANKPEPVAPAPAMDPSMMGGY